MTEKEKFNSNGITDFMQFYPDEVMLKLLMEDKTLSFSTMGLAKVFKFELALLQDAMDDKISDTQKALILIENEINMYECEQSQDLSKSSLENIRTFVNSVSHDFNSYNSCFETHDISRKEYDEKFYQYLNSKIPDLEKKRDHIISCLVKFSS